MKNKELLIVRIVFASSILLGYILAHYFSTQINSWFFRMDMMPGDFVAVGLCVSFFLFLGGFIVGLYQRFRL